MSRCISKSVKAWVFDRVVDLSGMLCIISHGTLFSAFADLIRLLRSVALNNVDEFVDLLIKFGIFFSCVQLLIFSVSN